MLYRIRPTEITSIAVIDSGEWVDPHAFPDQQIEETLPLEHDGLNLSIIQTAQEIEFATERGLADTDNTDYTVIDGVLYSLKRPTSTSPEYPRLVLPTDYRIAVIDRAHREVGHLAAATLTRVCEAYVWPSMRRQVRERLESCTICQNHSRKRDRVAMGTMPLAMYSMQIIGMDLVGPFVESPQGSRYILNIVDHCSLWAEAYPIPDKTTRSVWTAFANSFPPRFGAPEILITDNGQEFCATAWTTYLRDLGIAHHRTTPVHPHSNGRVERFNRTFKEMLAKFVNNETHTWEDRLGDVLAAYRISVSSVTGYTPYFFAVRPQ